MIRFPVTLIPYLFLLSFVAAGWLWHKGDERAYLPEATQAEPAPSIGGPFALTDQHGARVSDETYRGKYMLVFFGFTYCPDVCPTTLAVLSDALDKLGAKADFLVPIFITVDPERDTPEMLKNYLDAFGKRFVGLTGSAEDIAIAAKAYRVFYQKNPLPDGDYSLNHSSVIYLMGPDGKFLANYSIDRGPDLLAADLAKKIRATK